jgi:hypothetical protein
MITGRSWKWSNPRLGAAIRKDCVLKDCVRPLSRPILGGMRVTAREELKVIDATARAKNCNAPRRP